MSSSTAARKRVRKRAQVIPIQPAVARAEWNTPALLRLGLYLAIIGSLLFMIAVMTEGARNRDALLRVGRESAPEIFNAEHIRAGLAAMDADAARELLTRSDKIAPSDAFESDRTEVINAIVTAAGDAKPGDRARLLLQKLAAQLPVYTAQIQSARDFVRSGDKRFTDAYRQATATMDEQLLPAARDFEASNSGFSLDAAGSRSWSMAFTVTAALALGLVLLILQVFLAGRVRRILNPALLIATAVLVGFGLYATTSFEQGAGRLDNARVNEFQKVRALWRARAQTFSIDRDEGRLLLGLHPPSLHTRALLTQLDDVHGAIADLPEGKTFEQISRRIRSLDDGGQHQAAVTLYESAASSDFQATLRTLNGSLNTSLSDAQHAFDESIAAGLRDVAGFDVSAPVAAFVIALCVFLGLLPRLREYSV